MFIDEQPGAPDKKNKFTPHYDDFPEIIREELEGVLKVLGTDEKSVIIRNKIMTALAALSNNGGDRKKDFKKTLESFSSNLDKIIKEWD